MIIHELMDNITPSAITAVKMANFEEQYLRNHSELDHDI